MQSKPATAPFAGPKPAVGAARAARSVFMPARLMSSDRGCATLLAVSWSCRAATGRVAEDWLGKWALLASPAPSGPGPLLYLLPLLNVSCAFNEARGRGLRYHHCLPVHPKPAWT